MTTSDLLEAAATAAGDAVRERCFEMKVGSLREEEEEGKAHAASLGEEEMGRRAAKVEEAEAEATAIVRIEEERKMN